MQCLYVAYSNLALSRLIVTWFPSSYLVRCRKASFCFSLPFLPLLFINAGHACEMSLSIMDTIQCCNLCFRIPVMRREMCSHHKCINIWIEFCICVCFICRHSFFLSFILLILFNKVHPPQPWNGLGYIFHRELSWNINSCHWPSS